uniref:FBD domain-containing protein n=2 Tax=Aegilops tauschii TaxID=37682 RepID=A0A453QCV8_AEGTS
NRDLETFWKFTRNFTGTKDMRLSVNHLEDIAVLSEARQVELLPMFRRLERLEFHGAHWTKDKTAAVTTILNLLHCCPVLITLRINLTAKYEEEDASNKQGGHKQKGTTRKEILMAAMVGPRYLFPCLQSSLRKVDLQFQLEKKDCLGVKLIKTFAENAMVLEEIRIDSGDEKLCEHMNPRIAKWNSSRREFGATNFVLLPLKR